MKTAAINFRVEPELKAAVEKAAEDDSRSLASYMERLLVQHLKATGYWPPKKGA